MTKTQVPDTDLEAAKSAGMQEHDIYTTGDRRFALIDGEVREVWHSPAYRAVLDRAWTEAGLTEADNYGDEPLDRERLERFVALLKAGAESLGKEDRGWRLTDPDLK
jgi:hypothetical protein